MEIIQREDPNPNSKFVQNIPFGECFMFNDEIYYVIRHAGEFSKQPRHVLCLNISKSGLGYVEYDTSVTHIDSRLIWNHKR